MKTHLSIINHSTNISSFLGDGIDFLEGNRPRFAFRAGSLDFDKKIRESLVALLMAELQIIPIPLVTPSAVEGCWFLMRCVGDIDAFWLSLITDESHQHEDDTWHEN